MDTEVLQVAFGEQIKAIGATLIVASPWNNPAFLNRAWCLFELMTSVNVGVEITILLPLAEHEAFVEGLGKNIEVVFEALARIDARKAGARERQGEWEWVG